MEKTANHEEIARRLNSYLSTRLSEKESSSPEGFRKIAIALRNKQCNNADLDFLKIDLRAFEQLARAMNCYEMLFGGLCLNDCLEHISRHAKSVANQYESRDCFPDDHCARELPAYS